MFYASLDVSYNTKEQKSNLLLPTTICRKTSQICKQMEYLFLRLLSVLTSVFPLTNVNLKITLVYSIVPQTSLEKMNEAQKLTQLPNSSGL